MKPERAARDREYVIRDMGAFVVFWIGIAVIVLGVGDAVIRLDGPAIGFLLPLGLFAAWAIWVCLARPKIRYDGRQAVVTNIGRSHLLPWPRVRSVTQRLNIVFALEDGRTITASGATSNRQGYLAGAIASRLPVRESMRPAEALDAIRAASAPSDDPVVSRWETVPLAIGAVLAVAAIVDLVVTFVR